MKRNTGILKNPLLARRTYAVYISYLSGKKIDPVDSPLPVLLTVSALCRMGSYWCSHSFDHNTDSHGTGMVPPLTGSDAGPQ